MNSELYNASLQLLKKPKDLKNSYLDNSVRILLDANAIIDMVSNYELTHRIKILCSPETLLVYVPDFIRDEIKRERVRGKLSYFHIISELDSIFEQKIKDMTFDPKIDQQKQSIRTKYHELSNADAKCLLYAKYEHAILITSDKALKDACGIENIQYIDHYDDQKFSQTINSNFEKWFIGKIQRMKKHWLDLKESKISNETGYLEKRNTFRALFHSLLSQNVILKAFFLKIYADNESLSKKAEHFFVVDFV